MSLQLAITTASKLEVPNAVHKITNAAMASPTTLNVEVSVYADLASSQDGTPAVQAVWVCELTFDKAADVSMHRQAYDALKSLPQYAGAVDC